MLLENDYVMQTKNYWIYGCLFTSIHLFIHLAFYEYWNFIHCIAMMVSQGHLALQGTLGNICRHFSLSQLGKGKELLVSGRSKLGMLPKSLNTQGSLLQHEGIWSKMPAVSRLANPGEDIEMIWKSLKQNLNHRQSCQWSIAIVDSVICLCVHFPMTTL